MTEIANDTLSIRDLRIREDVQGVELARKLGIHPTTLSRYERGGREWPPHLENRARTLLLSGHCRTKSTQTKRQIVLVEDSSVQAFLVFTLFARDKEEVEERVRRYYAEQGWDYSTVGDIRGYVIKPKSPLFLGKVPYPTSPVIRLPRTRRAMQKS